MELPFEFLFSVTTFIACLFLHQNCDHFKNNRRFNNLRENLNKTTTVKGDKHNQQ